MATDPGINPLAAALLALHGGKAESLE